jgi:hypothetical protein
MLSVLSGTPGGPAGVRVAAGAFADGGCMAGGMDIPRVDAPGGGVPGVEMPSIGVRGAELSGMDMPGIGALGVPAAG